MGSEIGSSKIGCGAVSVIEDGEILRLYVDGDQQSAIDTKKPERLVLIYFSHMLSALLFLDKPRQLLLLGLGGGDLVRYSAYHFPDATITAYENNPEVVEVARRLFALPEQGERFVLHEEDAQNLSQHQHPQQDLIFIDLFVKGRLPASFAEATFFQACKKLLSPGGCLVLNLIPQDEMEFARVLAILRSVFQRRTLCLAVADHGNVVVLAFNQVPRTLDRKGIEEKAYELSELKIDFAPVIESLFTTNPQESGALLMG